STAHISNRVLFTRWQSSAGYWAAQVKRDFEPAPTGRWLRSDRDGLSPYSSGYSARSPRRLCFLAVARYPHGAAGTNTSYVLFYPLDNLLGVFAAAGCTASGCVRSRTAEGPVRSGCESDSSDSQLTPFASQRSPYCRLGNERKVR